MLTRSDGRVLWGACALALVAFGAKLWLGLAAPPAPNAALERAEPSRTRGHVVDLNRASFEELQALPGVGPTLAARILRHRWVHGPFRSVEELKQVPGIGPKRLERLRPHVYVCVRGCPGAGAPAPEAGR